MQVLPLELKVTPLTDDLHPWACLSPMQYDRLLVLKLIPAAKLAIRLESCKFTLVPHVVLKLVISEGHFAQCALELFAI